MLQPQLSAWHPEAGIAYRDNRVAQSDESLIVPAVGDSYIVAINISLSRGGLQSAIPWDFLHRQLQCANESSE
jgi:hypothetical protein